MSTPNKRVSQILNHISVATKNLCHVLITGCSRGIGYGLAQYLLTKRAKYFVIATCRSPNKSSKLQSLIDRFPGRAALIDIDISCEKSVIESVGKVSQITDKIDILINNAGISTSNHPHENILDFNATEMSNILQTNVVGPAIMFKYYYPLLMKNGSKVINISSASGSLDMSYMFQKFDSPTKKTMTSYSISKAALNMLMRCEAAQIGLKDNIIVMCIAPGWVSTDLGTSFGKRKAKLTVFESCEAMVKLIENATMSKHNGMFYNHKHQQLPW